MNIVIASGKGGTGKTTVAVNLASVLETSTAYLDCDVEEPNGHLFLKAKLHHSKPAPIRVPVVDEALCTGCGECVEACRFNALACVGKTVLVFNTLCHGCGGCTLACPENAITEVPHPIGVVETGTAGTIQFIQGRLNVGAIMSPPLIRAVKAEAPDVDVVLYDAPPGTSCPVITTLRGADVVVLVTEPTPFGLHDLKLAVETVRQMKLPFGVVINRADIGDDRVIRYCEENEIPVLAEIPNNREVAEAYSRGVIAVDAIPSLRRIFTDLFQSIQALAGSVETSDPVSAQEERTS
ncbi:MAG: P-loop NTPase [Candidatus Hydrogenedentes bacterium]|nr:P-loop NTPase [Candidatus Hydrogenedentota bacterium]